MTKEQQGPVPERPQHVEKAYLTNRALKERVEQLELQLNQLQVVEKLLAATMGMTGVLAYMPDQRKREALWLAFTNIMGTKGEKASVGKTRSRDEAPDREQG